MGADEASDKAEKLARLDQGFAGGIPHNRALGLQFVNFDGATAWLRLPYDKKLVGNPHTGVMHGGAITSMLDAACGAAVFLALKRMGPIATLDLRIDYLKSGLAHKDVMCRTECYKLTRHIAFARGIAYHDDESDPIACATGTFAIGTKGAPIPGTK